MVKSSKYVARKCDSEGRVHYPENEHAIWQQLFTSQQKVLQGRACQAFLDGVKLLALPETYIPQLNDINNVLRRETGWSTEGVAALISFDKFFSLLSNKKFPVATFIRSAEEMQYLQEPDIFHEIFGHCPLLTHPAFAHFTQQYGLLGANASKEDRIFLARLYWFTVEFGLLQTQDGLRIYGGGILSSPGETQYAIESATPERREFNLIDVLRTPYRIDIMQPIYYVLSDIDQLFEVAETDIMSAVNQAKRLGLFAPSFPPKQKLTG